MSDAASTDLVWYLAREGQQYGPITNDELAKLIELGHLRDGDLVWNPTFTDWQPAASVIASFAPAPASPPPPTVAEPTRPSASMHPATSSPADTARHAQDSAQQTGTPAANPSREATHDPAIHSGHGTRHDSHAHGERGHDAFPSPSPAAQQTRQPAHHEPSTGRPSGEQPRAERPRDGYGQAAQAAPGQSQYRGEPAMDPRQPVSSATTGRPAQSPDHRRGDRPGGRPQSDPYKSDPSTQPSGRRSPVTSDPARRAVAVDEDAFDDYEEERSGSWMMRIAASIVALAVIGGGGWFAYQNREAVMDMVANFQSGTPKPVATIDNGGSIKVRPTTTSAIQPSGSDRIAFLETPLWKKVTEAFPTWSDERRQEAVDLLQSGKDEAAIQVHMVNAIAKLRRQHAKDALSASPNTLRSLAGAFLANLRSMTSKGPETCYEFISKGETGPGVLAMLDDPEAGQSLTKQMHVTVEAIVDGRDKPNTYLPPRQSDYSMISNELSKMGWSNDDMQLFGDPQALAKAPPAKVCQLVTDWFTAQLMVQDQDIQSRLLVQSLRPVVAG